MADTSASLHKLWTFVTSVMKAKLSPFIAPVTVNNSRKVIGNENGNLEFHEYAHYEMYIQNSLKHDRNTNVCKTQTRQCCHLTKILEF